MAFRQLLYYYIANTIVALLRCLVSLKKIKYIELIHTAHTIIRK